MRFGLDGRGSDDYAPTNVCGNVRSQMCAAMSAYKCVLQCALTNVCGNVHLKMCAAMCAHKCVRQCALTIEMNQ